MQNKDRQPNRAPDRLMRTKQVQSGQSGYDLAMILDFLDHLLWEYRLLNFDLRANGTADNSELVESCQKYRSKYGVGLIPRNGLKNDVRDPRLWEEANAKYEAALIQLSQAAIDTIESTRPFLQAALLCAQTAEEDRNAVGRFRASQVLGIDPPVKATLPEDMRKIPLHFPSDYMYPEVRGTIQDSDIVLGIDEKSDPLPVNWARHQWN